MNQISVVKFPSGKPFSKIEYRTESFKFSAGEVQAVLDIDNNDDFCQKNVYLVELNIHSSDDIMHLLMVTDIIKRADRDPSIVLIIPYLPYSRQDRVMNSGEALSIKVFSDLINSQNYDAVYTWDSHSDVGVALINKCINKPSHELLNYGMIKKLNKPIIVSPDAGANKKSFQFAKHFGIDTVVRADKVRDVRTGQISGTEVYTEHVGDRDFLIVDDICDGGRTFTELAKKLESKTDGKIYLYVTHGIFSKGLQPLMDSPIHQVWCANIFDESLAEQSLIYNDDQTPVYNFLIEV